MAKNPRARDAGSIPESGLGPGGGSSSPLRCSCLENPTDRGAWWATAHGVAKSQTGLSRAHTQGGRIRRVAVTSVGVRTDIWARLRSSGIPNDHIIITATIIVPP